MLRRAPPPARARRACTFAARRSFGGIASIDSHTLQTSSVQRVAIADFALCPIDALHKPPADRAPLRDLARRGAALAARDDVARGVAACSAA